MLEIELTRHAHMFTFPEDQYHLSRSRREETLSRPGELMVSMCTSRFFEVEKELPF